MRSKEEGGAVSWSVLEEATEKKGRRDVAQSLRWSGTTRRAIRHPSGTFGPETGLNPVTGMLNVCLVPVASEGPFSTHFDFPHTNDLKCPNRLRIVVSCIPEATSGSGS